jgi:predicted GNAT family N-acyltransferase
MVSEIRNLISVCYPAIDHDVHVTNRFFLYIEKNHNILNQYLRLCRTNNVETVNRWIGRLLKTTYDLPNTGRAIATSSLIKTYTLH